MSLITGWLGIGFVSSLIFELNIESEKRALRTILGEEAEQFSVVFSTATTAILLRLILKVVMGPLEFIAQYRLRSEARRIERSVLLMEVSLLMHPANWGKREEELTLAMLSALPGADAASLKAGSSTGVRKMWSEYDYRWSTHKSNRVRSLWRDMKAKYWTVSKY